MATLMMVYLVMQLGQFKVVSIKICGSLLKPKFMGIKGLASF